MERSQLSAAIDKVYQDLIIGKISFFTLTQNGEVLIEKTGASQGSVQIVPGSFNPLHDAHRWIFDVANFPLNPAHFEMSIRRWDKPDVPKAELVERLEQFQGYAPVIVTNQARMIGKLGILRTLCLSDCLPIVHVGMDTLQRMFDDYGVKGVAGLHAHFVIHNRNVNGRIVRLDDLKEVPVNCSPGREMAVDMQYISSTNIRNTQKIQMG